MPVSHPRSLVSLVCALAGALDADHGVAGIHDRANDAFDRLSQGRHTVPDRTSQVIFNRDSADLGETLVDLQIAAVGGKEGKTNWCRVIDQLQGGLLRWRQARNLCRFRLSPFRIL